LIWWGTPVECVPVMARRRREGRLSRSGLIELIDLETRRRRLVDASNRRVRSAFEAEAADLQRAVSRMVIGAGGQYLPVQTDMNWAEDLVELFRQRERGR